MVILRANTVVVDRSADEFIVIGFADETDGIPRDRLVLQRSYEPDEQDLALGMDQVYIERNEQSRGGYGGVRELVLSRDRLNIGLEDAMAQTLGDDAFEITFALDDERFQELRDGLRRAVGRAVHLREL